MKAIYLDMDGTIVDLYGHNNWAAMLDSEDVTPYKNAKPKVNLCSLAKILNNKQKKGYSIGIISWLSKTGTQEYNQKVKQIKENWLKTHLKSVNFDEIKIVEYGTPKETIINHPTGILFDDDIQIRIAWPGEAFDETDLINNLKSIK